MYDLQGILSKRISFGNGGVFGSGMTFENRLEMD